MSAVLHSFENPPGRDRTSSRTTCDRIAPCLFSPDRVAFVDIETTGLSLHYDEITVVGATMGGHTLTWVKGDDPTSLISFLDEAQSWVTFNGLRFDAKFLKQEFPELQEPSNHLDLMYLCRSIGWSGGQKSIEKLLGIEVRDQAVDVDGAEVVLLWHRHLRGAPGALEKLVRYNRADIAAMGAILDAALNELHAQLDLFSSRSDFAPIAARCLSAGVPGDLADRRPSGFRIPTFSVLFEPGPAEGARVVGIDLTGSEKRATGWALLEGCSTSTSLISSTEEIIEMTLEARPDLVSIDSPLCLPLGRRTAFDDDPTRAKYGIMRSCERELKRRGINVYPCLLPSMQKLTVRGIEIAQALRAEGVDVIESYPGAAQDIIRVPRKGKDHSFLRAGLREFGLYGDIDHDGLSHDELDAITSALVGTFKLAGHFEELDNDGGLPMVIPRLPATW